MDEAAVEGGEFMVCASGGQGLQSPVQMGFKF